MAPLYWDLCSLLDSVGVLLHSAAVSLFMRDDAKAAGLVTWGRDQVNGTRRLWVLYFFARVV